jgi:hypothetical protein
MTMDKIMFFSSLNIHVVLTHSFTISNLINIMCQVRWDVMKSILSILTYTFFVLLRCVYFFSASLALRCVYLLCIIFIHKLLGWLYQISPAREIHHSVGTHTGALISWQNGEVFIIYFYINFIHLSRLFLHT